MPPPGNAMPLFDDPPPAPVLPPLPLPPLLPVPLPPLPPPVEPPPPPPENVCASEANPAFLEK